MLNAINKQNNKGEKFKNNFIFPFFSFFLIIFFFNGCNFDSPGNKTSVEESTGDFYIKSAVYDNNATSTPLDDKLYIYFDQAINPASIAIDMSTNYTLEGSGVIGTASTSVYYDTRFHQHIISLNNNGSTSTALVANDTNISIATNVIEDTSGNYTIYDANKTTLEKFKVVLKTGQTTSYPNGNTIDRDDGYYQTGKARSYTDNGQTVTDNSTGLIWQKEDDNTAKNWVDAGIYCDGILLDSSSGFRLPTIEELVELTDKSRSSPSVDPIFINTNSTNYWSSTSNAETSTNAWRLNFDLGFLAEVDKSNTSYVRCVR